MCPTAGPLPRTRAPPPPSSASQSQVGGDPSTRLGGGSPPLGPSCDPELLFPDIACRHGTVEPRGAAAAYPSWTGGGRSSAISRRCGPLGLLRSLPEQQPRAGEQRPERSPDRSGTLGRAPGVWRRSTVRTVERDRNLPSEKRPPSGAKSRESGDDPGRPAGRPAGQASNGPGARAVRSRSTVRGAPARPRALVARATAPGRRAMTRAPGRALGYARASARPRSPRCSGMLPGPPSNGPERSGCPIPIHRQ